MTPADSETTTLVPCLRADLAWLRSQHVNLASVWEASAVDGLWPVASTVGHERALAELLVGSGEVARAVPDRVTVVVPFVRGGHVLLAEDVDSGGARAWGELGADLAAMKGGRVRNRLDPEAEFEVRRGASTVSIAEVRRRARGRSLEIPIEQFGTAVRRAECQMDDFEHRLRVVLLLRQETEAAERYLHALVGLGRESARTAL